MQGNDWKTTNQFTALYKTAGDIAGSAYVGKWVEKSTTDYVKALSPNTKGGRLGNADTRQHNFEIVETMKIRGYRLLETEEFLPGVGGGRKGSSFVDMTFQNVSTGRILRINTVDTYADATMTSREAKNAARIRKQIQPEHLLTIPKRK